LDALKNGDSTIMNGIKTLFPDPKPDLQDYKVAKEVRLSVTVNGKPTYRENVVPLKCFRLISRA
jgi:hypothetical protein